MRVLVVDDDGDLRTVLAEVLADEGFEVAESSGAHEALREIERSRPDVILLDQVMPSLNGPALLRLIRGTPGGERIPVVVISGSHPLPSTLALANGYVEKPFDIAKVVELVRRVAAGTPVPA